MPFLPMRKNTTLNNSAPRWSAIFAAIFALFFVAAINDARAQFTFASDSADNYGGSWANGSDQGTGFNGWGLTAGANSGGFIGNPSTDGMGTTGLGTTAFGTYSTGSGYFNASRGFEVGMGIGDTFTFYWAINFDAGGGSKGFDLRSDGTTIFNVNNTGSSTITTTGGGSLTGYGTTPMLVTLTRTSASGYSFSMTSRSGGSTFSTNISSSSTINNFNFYIGNQNDGDGRKNMFFDTFSITNSGVFSQGGSVTNANTFSGSGALSIGNSTTLVLSGGGNNNYTGATTISNGSTLVFAGAGTSQFASTIGGGTGNVVMSNSSGTVILTNNNTYTGNTTVAAGILRIGHANAMGSTGTLTVNSAGQLQLSNGISINRAITLSGDGPGSGALRSVSGDNTWQGNITLGSGTRINSDTGLLTLSGSVSGGANTLFLGGAGNLSIGGQITATLTTGNGAIFK
ncbi:MAG: autotransporter-associated beta strand repeat-containing protein, partial [Chthoniobacterales bacterium]